MIHKLHAVILWSRRSREADKIVGLYSDTYGRLTARATSAARSVAKFVGLTEPFVECELAVHLRPDDGWGKIVGGQLIRSFPRLRMELARTTAAAWVCELIHRMTPEGQVAPEKFSLLLETLEALENASHFNLVRLAYAVRFLSHAGFGLDNREAWQALQQAHPEVAEALLQQPMADLGEMNWESQLITDLQQLAGSVVNDHLSHPLHVNRFRQMTGVEI
jgi:recombinational DNA repair protein (RecF pathway)